MNTRTQISMQAAAWISRLNADDRTAAMDAACREWLNADPRHRAAFEIANRMWEDASTLPVSVAARIGRANLPPAELAPLDSLASGPSPAAGSRVKRWAIAAGVTLAVLAGALLYLQRPQVLETRTGQQLTVPLEDGSLLLLNTDTRIRVRFDKQARRLDLESGEALFDVAKDSARPFVVRAGDREITALGTQFVVRYDQAHTAVTLMDGKVAVSAVTGLEDSVPGLVAEREEPHPPAVADPSLSSHEQRGEDLRGMTVLEPGERVTFVQSTRLAKIDRPAIDAVTAWRKGEILFENTPLSKAIEEMNRYSVRKLKLGAGAPAQMSVSGLFRSGDSENFALALTTTHSLQAIEHEGEIEIRAR